MIEAMRPVSSLISLRLPRVFGALVVEQDLGVFGVAADRRQRLVEFVADARRHGAQHRQLAGLDQLVLGAHQLLLGVLALQHGAFEAGVEAFEVGGALGHAVFQLMAGAGLEVDAVDVMAAALHHQAGQQHGHQQRTGADGHDRLHRAVDQGARREDADLPAGFLDVAGLGEPGVVVQAQRLRRLGRVGLDGDDRLALGFGQLTGSAKAPVRARGEDDHAVLVGQQQLFGGTAPQGFGVVEVDLDHQHADHPLTVVHGGGEEVAALGRRGALAEEAPQVAVHGF
jgi:hypothetical protein